MEEFEYVQWRNQSVIESVHVFYLISLDPQGVYDLIYLPIFGPVVIQQPVWLNSYINSTALF